MGYYSHNPEISQQKTQHLLFVSDFLSAPLVSSHASVWFQIFAPHEFSPIYSESLARLAKSELPTLITASPNSGSRYASEVRLGIFGRAGLADFASGEIDSRMRVYRGATDRRSGLAGEFAEPLADRRARS